LHYTYPHGFPAKEIIPVMQGSSKICRYLDMPVQHINEKILKLMNRGHGRKEIEEIFHIFRSEVPDIAIRTTFITGFPGETEDDFMELLGFIGETRFDRLGVFTYSEEDGTAAAELKDDIPEEIKEERKSRILSLQERISLELNLDKIGKLFRVIVDRQEGEFHACRTEHDSPEIDNEVLIPLNSAGLRPGEFTTVRIVDAIEYDLYGEVAEDAG
jgi:ribosomal protein S12 methylthiotransferase